MFSPKRSHKPADPLDSVPEDFPSGVEVRRMFYQNWDQSVLARRVLQCHPTCEADIERVANWAAGRNWTVRATGVKHNWSPITITPQGATTDLDGVVLVNLMKHMTKVTVHAAADGKPAHAVAQLGVGHLAFLTALEQHKDGGRDDIGYGLTHTPAPDSITLGGILAIGGHGTALPTTNENKYNDPKTALFGTYSNRVLAVRALVWDADTSSYKFKEFRRERGDEVLPFLTHVGRAVLSEATLQVEKNYYMRCQSIMNVHWEQMFPKTVDAKNPPEHSMAWHLKRSGRAEAIWFPFTDNPWLKVWTVTGKEKPTASREVKDALNYPFSDELSDYVTERFRSVMGDGQSEKQRLITEALQQDKRRYGEEELNMTCQNLCAFFQSITVSAATVMGSAALTPFICKTMWLRVLAGLSATRSWDIWGPSKNTLVYVRDSTARVTANGYVIMTTEDNVQDCMYEFAQMYNKLLAQFAEQGKYPISMPLEIRVTGIDDTAALGDGSYATTPMSSLTYDEEAKANGWTHALWLDVLSFPSATHSNEFYVEMEKLVLECAAFNAPRGRIRPEWSKGWGYTAEGPWKSTQFIDHTRRSLPRWNEMVAELEKHDPKKLFTNPWMSSFFVQV